MTKLIKQGLWQRYDNHEFITLVLQRLIDEKCPVPIELLLAAFSHSFYVGDVCAIIIAHTHMG